MTSLVLLGCACQGEPTGSDGTSGAQGSATHGSTSDPSQADTTVTTEATGPSSGEDSEGTGPAPPDAGDPNGCAGRSIVELVGSGPVYSMSEIPFSGAQGPPFAGSMYLPAGYFAVAGDLNINVGLNPAGQWLGAGQYVFTPDGELVSLQHIAYDARQTVPFGCGEGVHFQSEDMDLVGAASFLRTPRGADVEGLVFQLQPLLYEVDAGGVSFLGAPAIAPTGTNDCHLERNYRTSAVVDGSLVTVEEIPGGSQVGTRTVVLSLPEFGEIGEATVQDCDGNDAPAMTPLFGVGPYLVARQHDFTSTNPVDGQPFPQGCLDAGGLALYAVRGGTVSLMEPLQDPAEYIRVVDNVAQIVPSPVLDHTFDVLDPMRFAVALRTWERTVVRTYRLDEELVEESSRDLGDAVVEEMALAGPYLARLQIPDNEQIIVEEDGVALHVPEAPLDESGLPNLTTVALSAEGTMLVGQRSQLSLYQIDCP